MPRRQVRLLLVDDHRVVRLGLAALFKTVPHFDVVGEASTSSEALAEARRYLPHVALMDVRCMTLIMASTTTLLPASVRATLP